MAVENCTIGGKSLKNVVGFEMSVNRRTDHKGHPSGHTLPARFVLWVDVSVKGTTIGLDALCNEDGGQAFTSLKFDVKDDMKRTLIQYDIPVCFVNAWQLSSSGDQGMPTYERIELCAGDVKMASAGNNSTFKLADFYADE